MKIQSFVSRQYQATYCTDKSLAPKLTWIHNLKIAVCLKQDNLSFNDGKVVNLFIICELDLWSRELISDYLLGNCLCRAVMLTKNADPVK